MKITYLSSSTLPSTSANSLHVMKMCAAFASLGHDVTLFARAPRDSADSDQPHSFYGVPETFGVIRLPVGPISRANSISYAARVSRIVSRLDCDILYGRDLWSLYMSRRYSPRLIYEAHVPPRNSLRRRVECRLFRAYSFSRLVVISQALRNWYESECAVLVPERIAVARDATDPPAALVPGAAEAAGGIFRVGYVGHLYPGKGMEVISELAKILPDVEFHVVGGTGADLNHWRARIKSKNVVLHGHAKHAELQHKYSTFDCLVAPYQPIVRPAGGKNDIAPWMSPLKIFEYMAQGKAIVASDLPTIREILTHSRNALLCSPSDITAWADSIRLLRGDRLLQARLSQTALADVAKHTWAARARMVIA